MTATSVLQHAVISNLPLLKRGKIRDMFSVDSEHMLMVATDRVSAYDSVMETPIPGKGAILTRISNFWFNMMEDIAPNHLSHIPLEQVITDEHERAFIGDRAIVVKKLQSLPFEGIVRGYLFGSVEKEYITKGTICGIPVTSGLQKAEKIPEGPLFTPSTKAMLGDHDENIRFDELEHLIGPERARRCRDICIQIYKRAAAYALERGIIIADTKFELGEDENGVIYIIDEILTPDSSRFWPVKTYRVGESPESFDKQYIRDYLTAQGLNKNAKGVVLPDEVKLKTMKKYNLAETILTK